MMNRNFFSRFQWAYASMVKKNRPVWAILWPLIFTLVILAGLFILAGYARPASAEEQKGIEVLPPDVLATTGNSSPSGPTSPSQAKPAAALMARPPMADQLVYSNDFEGSVGAEWSTTAIDTTPVGGRKFLGRFTNSTASLSLNDLPAHAGILVMFDLFIIQSWDGNGSNGPDIWQLNAGADTVLLNTTFSNGATQAYPGTYPGGSNPPYTGASEIGTLGYTWSSSPSDSFYQISKIFTHTVPTLTLNFLGSNLQALNDESWGIDNVAVYLLPGSSSAVTQLAASSPITQSVSGDVFNLTVTALDGLGDVTLDYTGTVAFTSSDPQATLPLTYTFTVTTTGDNGRHTFPGLALRTAGLQTVTAFDVADPTIQGTFTTTVLPGPADPGASQLTVTGPHLADDLDEATITVTAVDNAGNPIPGAQVWIEAGGLGNALSPANGVTNAGGVFSTTLTSTQAEAKVIRALIGDGQTMVWLPGAAIVEFTRSAVSGVVFSDLNRDGELQGGEPGLGGVQVTLYPFGSTEPLKTTVSQSDGSYLFTGLISGTYRLEQVRLDQYAFSSGGSLTVTVADFATDMDNNFGNYAAAQVGGEVWNDGNQDGQIQQEEPPIPGVTINALDNEDQLVDSTTTDDDGRYHLDLAAGLPAAPDNFVFNSGRFALREPATAVIGNNSFDRGLMPLDLATYPDNYDFATGDLGDWTVTDPAYVSVVDDSYSLDGHYLQINRYEQSAYTPPFTVPPNAQSLRFDYYVWTDRDSATARPLYVYVYGGEDFSVVTSLGSVSGSNLQGWQKAVFDLQAFQGETIQLRFRTDTDSYWNGRARIDNISLNTELPDWTFDNALYTAVISDNFSLDGQYLQLNRYEQSAYSPAFVVPENAQSLRFDYYAWTTRDSATARPLYVYAYGGDDFSVITSLGSVSGSSLQGWREAVFDLQAFQGQTIKLRFRTDTDSYWNGLSRIDNIALYAETPNWDPTSVLYVTIGQDVPPTPTQGATAPENADFAQEPVPLAASTYPENYDFSLGRTPLPTTTYPSNYDFASGNLGEWTVTDSTYGAVISDVYNLDGYHLRLDRYEVSAYSQVFTLPAETESLRFDYYNYSTVDSATARPLYIYVYSGPTLETVTHIGTVNGSKLQGWQSAVIDIQAFQSQTIQLRFRTDTDSYWNGRSRIDNLSLEVEVPEWEITSSTYVQVVDDSRSLPGSGSHLLLNGYEQSVYSTPLAVPTDAQSLRFDYYNYSTIDSNTARPLYVYVYSGPTFETVTHIGTVNGADLEGWKTAVIDVQAYQGQTIIFRFRTDTDSYWNGRSRIDNISFYTDLPAWTPTSAYYVSVKADDPPVNPPTNITNSDFSNGPVVLPAATYPDNYDFSQTRIALDPASYPSNYDFETGDLGEWTVSLPTYGQVVSDTYNLSGPYLRLSRYEVSTYSPVFTVPVETQSLRFDYYNWTTRDTVTARPLYIYVYSGPDLSSITHIGTVNGSESLGWQEGALDLQAFQGQAIQLRFRTDTDSYWNGQSRIDNISLHEDLPVGWTPSTVTFNYVRIVSDTFSINGPYLHLGRYEMSAYSPSFTVPENAQSLHFNYYNWTTRDTVTARPLYVYVYSGSELATVTHIGTINGSQSQGWQTARLDLQRFQGQTIRLRFRSDTDSYWNGQSRIDNISLKVEVPGWTMTDANLVTIQSTDGISGPHLLLDRYEVSAYTPAFLVPTTTASLTFDYFNWTTRDTTTARPLYVYAYGGDNFSVITYLGSVSGSQTTGWQSATLDLSNVRGRYIKLRFRTDTDSYWNGRSRIDNVSLVTGTGGFLPGSEYSDSGDYVHLSRYEISVYSTAFLVPTNTENLTFDYFNWADRDATVARPLYIYALSGPDFAFTTHIGTVSGSHRDGWRQASINLSSFSDQIIKLRFRTDTDSYWNGQSKIDNVALTLNPGGGGGAPPDTHADGTYIYLSRYETSVYSAAFDVPTTTQSLRFDHFTWTSRDTATARPLYVYVLSGPDFGTTTSLGAVFGSALQGWKEAIFNLTAFQGQTIKLRFRTDTDSYWNGTSKIDNVYLLPLATESYTIEEINPVNYTSTTSDTVDITAYGGAAFTIDFGDFAVDRYQSTVEVVPTEIVADGVATAVVTVTLRDGTGAPLPGYEVEIKAPGTDVFITQPLSPTNAAGQAVGYISSTHAQVVEVTAHSVNDNVTLAQAIPLTFVAGLPDADNSTLTVDPTHVVANGVDESTFTVTLLDAYNNPVPGKTVYVTADSSTITLTMNVTQTNPQGEVSGTVRSNVAQTVTLMAEDTTDGITVNQTADILFTSADPVLSSVEAAPTTLVADGVSTATITVTLRDQNGEPLPDKPIELFVDGEDSYINGQPAGGLVAIGDSGGDGVVTAVLSSTAPGLNYIDAYGDGILLAQQAVVTFTVGTVDADASTLEADVTTVFADGVSDANLTVTLYDSYDHPVPNKTVVIETTGNDVTITQPSAPTDEQGQVQAMVRSTTVQTVTVTAVDQTDGITLTQTVVLDFVPGPADEDQSSAVISPTTILANGIQTTTITITVRDALGHPAAYRIVQLLVSGSNNTITPAAQGTTDENGIVTFHLASTTPQVKQISLRDIANDVVIAIGSAEFVVGAADDGNSELTANKTSIDADTVDSATVTAVIRDNYGHPLPGKEVVILSTGTNISLTQAVTTTNAAGQVQAVIRSSEVQTVTVTAVDVTDGFTLTQVVTLTFTPAPASAANSTIIVTPTTVLANNLPEVTITATLQDALGRPLSGRPIQLQVSGSGNTIIPAPQQTADISGTVVFQLASTKAETKQISLVDVVGGITLPAGSVVFEPVPVDADNSEIVILGSNTAAANGQEAVAIRVTARDAFNNVVPGVSVVLTSTGAVNFIQPPVTNGSGQATGYVTSQVVGPANIQAIVDGVLLNDSAVIFFEGPDLAVGVNAPTEVTAGYPLTYSISIANEGYLTATNVIVTDTLPNHTSFVSQTAPYSYTYDSTTRQIVWEVGTLPDGASESFIVRVDVSPGAPVDGTLTNQLKGVATEPELNTANNDDTAATLVKAPTPMLSVVPLYPTLIVPTGLSNTLVVTITNNGTGIMTGVSAAPPAHTPWATLSQTSFGDLLPGQWVTFTVTADASSVSTNGHYRDRIRINTVNTGFADIFTDIHVRPSLRDLTFEVNNNLASTIPGAGITLAEPVFVVTEGVSATQTYYRQATTTANGKVTFYSLESDKAYSYNITAANHDPASGSVNVVEGSGAQTLAVVLNGRAGLSVTPGSVAFAMFRGDLAQETLVIQNTGAADLTDIALSASGIPFLFLGQPPVGTIVPPGGSIEVTVNAAPLMTDTIDIYNGSILVTAAGGQSTSIPVEARLLDVLSRDLCIEVRTDLGNPLTQAEVRLTDQLGQVVSTGGVTETIQQVYVENTGDIGTVCFEDLHPGPYHADVGRGEIRLGQKDIEVEPGEGIQEELIIVEEPSVTATWSVTPTTIEDVYTTVLTLTFIPHAVPQLAFSPDRINLCGDSDGVVTQIVTLHNFYPVTLTNTIVNMEYNGNITASVHDPVSGASTSGGSMYIGTLSPNEHRDMELTAAVNMAACMGDQGLININVEAEYQHFVPESWYHVDPTNNPAPPGQESRIPLKVANVGFPEQSNLNSIPPTLENVTLIPPQLLTWMDVSTTTLGAIPVGEEAGFDLVVNPPQYLAQGLYYDYIQVTAENGITAMIGIEAEMDATGLHIETQFVTPLTAGEGGPGGGTTPPIQIGQPPEDWDDIVTFWNPDIFGPQDAIVGNWNILVGCYCSSGGGGWAVVGNSLIHVQGGGGPGPGFAYAPDFKDNVVILELSQKYSLDREAFIAQLNLSNALPEAITDVEVSISFMNGLGNEIPTRQPGTVISPTGNFTPVLPSNSLVPTSTIMQGTPGGWQKIYPVNFISIPETPTALEDIPSGENQFVSWTLVPDAPGLTEQAYFTVQAIIRYKVNGVEKILITSPSTISVSPQPRIVLDYFIPNYVLGGQTFDWLVVATNVGYGTARNFRVETPQPKIIKQSEQYPTDFTLIGPSVLNWGDVPPGEQVSGVWRILPSNPGSFVDWKATCKHKNYMGVELPELVYCVPRVHFLDTSHLAANQQRNKGDSCFGGLFQAFSGDPVNTFSGNFTFSDGDVTIPGWGAGLQFERSYNSDDTEDGPFGPGWTHSYNMDLSYETIISRDKETNEISQVTYFAARMPHGSIAYFAVSPDGNTITPFPGVKAELTRDFVTYTLVQECNQMVYTYNAAQKLTAVEDPNGNRTELTYDGSGNLTAVTDESGRSLTFTYDSNNHITSMTDPLGRVAVYTYTLGYLSSMRDFRGEVTQYTYTLPGDQPGKLRSMVDPNGNTEFFNHYDENGRVDWQEDALGNRTTFTYNVNAETEERATTTTDALGYAYTDEYSEEGLLVGRTDSFNSVETYDYDDHNNLIRMTDKNNHVTLYEWDECGCEMLRLVDPMGNTSTMTYNAQHQVLTVEDERGFITTYTYDGTGVNPLTMTDPLGETMSYTYGPHGEKLSETDQNGNTTYFAYDQYGNTVVITNALGYITHMTYDLGSRMIATTDALSRTTTYVYDDGDKLLSTTNPLSGTTSFTYDAVGNMTSMTDALGRTTIYEHDARNLLIRTTDPLGGVIETTYDANRNVIAQTDANGHTTTYTYDGFNVIITNPLSGTIQFTNDPVGNRIQEIDANGNVTQYVYDANDRVIQTIYPNGSIMSAVYDPGDNLLRLNDGEGRAVIYTYDEVGRVETKTDPEGGLTTYSYDGVGNQVEMEDPEGRVTVYTYDALNQLTAVTNPLGDVTTFTYDAVGNQISLTDANANSVVMVYDTLDRLTQVTDPLSGTTQYAYDAVGNPLQVTNPLGQVQTTQYDALNRPVTVTNALSGTVVYSYDAIGNVLAMTDEEGNATQYSYDELNRPLVITDPLGGTTTFTYDPNGNILSQTDAEGRVTTFAYDVFNQVVTTTNPLSGTTVYVYDHVGNILQATDPNGHAIQYDYDGLDRVITATDSLSGTTQFVYDDVGNLLVLTDPEGNATTTTYDDLNRPSTVTNALNNSGTYEYDPVGNLIRMTDAEGRVTEYIYDDLNRLVQLVDPLGNVTTYGYDALGNQVSLEDALGREMTFEYDELNRLVTMTNPISGTMVYTYSAAGNLLAERNPNGQVTTYSYDNLYRPIQITDPLGQATFFTYDAVGNLLATTDPLSRTTTFIYDDLNRLVQMTNPAGGTRLMIYDPVGNQVGETDENGRTIGYAYDALNRLVAVTDPLSQVTTFTYDAVGNQLSLTDPLTRTTSYSYDAIYRLETITDAAGQQSSYTYDQVDNVLTMTDAAGRTTTFTYDDLNRPVAVTNPLSGTMQFSYDAVGNQTAVTDALGRVMTYTYDALDRLATLTDPLHNVTQYEYDPLGNLVSMTDALGRVTTYQYDTLNRLAAATDALNNQSFFTYDAVGNLVSQEDELGNTTQYTFDNLDRLTTVTDALSQTMVYTYDPVGNLLQLQDGNGAISHMVYDPLNRLTSHTNPLGQTTTFTYDAVGNQTRLTDPLGNQTTFTYDVLDRVASITDPLNRTATYEYDPVGNQVGMTDAEGVVTQYEYDALNRLTAVTENFMSGGPSNATVNVTSEYAYDIVGNLTEMTNPLGNSFSFTYDALNRLTSSSDPLGYSSNYTYDPMGNLVSMVDPNQNSTSYNYDALNRLTTIARPDELVNFTYDAAGNRLSMSDLTGLTQYTYDAVYRLTSVTDPLSQTVQYTYDAAGNRTGLVYPDGDNVTYDYDDANRLTTVTDWDNGETQYVYDDNGRLTQVLLPNNITGTFGYDAASQLTLLQYEGITGTLGSYVYSYDQVGNRVEAIETVVMPDLVPTALFVASPLNGAAPLEVEFYNNSINADTYVWDFGDGQVFTTTSALTLTHIYSQTGAYTVTLTAENENFSHTLQRTNYILVVPPEAFQEIGGQVVIEAEHFYDNLPHGPQSWLTRTLVAGYEGESYMQALPDRNRVYASDYITSSPELQLQVNFVTPGTYTVWIYGSAPNARGDSVHVGLNSQANPGSENITGFIPRQWSWSSQTAAGTPATLDIPAPGLYTISIWMREDGFRFDRIILTTDGGFTPTGGGPPESPQAGDLLAALFGATESATNSWFTVKQDGMAGTAAAQNRGNRGLLAANILANPGLMLLGPLGLVMPFAFRRRKRRREIQIVTAVLIVVGLAGLGWALAYGGGFTDGLGADLPFIPLPSNEINPLVTEAASQGNHEALFNLAQQASSVRTITYAYDPLYRLTGASYSTGESFNYSYDAAGNRLTASVNGGPATNYIYDVANRLIQAGSQSYNYDNNGNLLGDGAYTYTYDTANRLTRLEDGISAIDYTYNGDGVRVSQMVDGIQTNYVQDVAAPLPQVLTASQGGTVSKYLYGLGLIGEERGGTGPMAPPAVWQYTLADALGSIRQVTDAAGNVLLGQHFDPFGGLMASNGSATSAFGFAGEEQDPLTGLLYLRARTYNPETGRFLQQDTVFGDPAQPRTLHRYTYGFNSPVNYTDPSGHMPAYGGGYIGGGSGGMSAVGGGSVFTFMGAAPLLSVNALDDPPANGGESENRPFLCQLADFAGDVVDTAAQVVNWALENPDLAIGIAIIAAAVVLTGGAAIPMIIAGAAFGAAFGYGMEVAQNFSEGMSIFDAFYMGNIDWSNVARAGFHGAVSGAVAGVLEPVFSIAGASGLVKAGMTAFGEFVSGRVAQVAINVMNGDAWDKDLWNLTDIALDVLPGVAAASAKPAWKALRGANDGPSASQINGGGPSASQLNDGPSASHLNDGPSASQVNNPPNAASHADDLNTKGSCAFNSFTAGTLVATATGMVAIEEIQVGDYVLAEDPDTGEQGYFEVVSLTDHPTDEIFEITVEVETEEQSEDSEEQETAETDEDKDDENSTNQEVMQITADHPVYVEGRGWVFAENLGLGERLRRADGGMAKVLAIEHKQLDEPVSVYNFTVKGLHTYFVLQASVLVHNAPTCDYDQIKQDIITAEDQVQTRVGTTPEGTPTKGAVGTDGPLVISGRKEIDGFTHADPIEVRNTFRDKFDHQFPSASKYGGLDKNGRTIFYKSDPQIPGGGGLDVGVTHAGHAEPKMVYLSIDKQGNLNPQPMAISNVEGMCAKCQRALRDVSGSTGQNLVVSSPKETYVFVPTETVNNNFFSELAKERGRTFVVYTQGKPRSPLVFNPDGTFNRELRN